MPASDMYIALITVSLFIPFVIVCQWVLPFGRYPERRQTQT